MFSCPFARKRLANSRKDRRRLWRECAKLITYPVSRNEKFQQRESRSVRLNLKLQFASSIQPITSQCIYFIYNSSGIHQHSQHHIDHHHDHHHRHDRHCQTA
uniref:Uncharacterized protein n=1 Tax=Glossina pallidipes TaxID=7398 RepID=A0A1A9ZTL9_GLOPL